jgi:endonuclease/exonuclease/phosphatase (EEP) superfamily protein YafD
MKWLRGATVVVGVVYPLAILAGLVTLAWAGERWWVTTVALYLPRITLAAPLPFVALALVLCRAWRLVALQAVAALLILFPLMGFVLPGPTFSDAHAPSLRVLSYNINGSYGGVSAIIDEVVRYGPDLVALQEIGETDALRQELAARYPTIEVSGQFLTASKYPFVSSNDPDRLRFQGRMRSPRYVSYVVDTPGGRLTFFNVHPISPRDDFSVLRGHGLRREILSGHLFSGDAAPEIQSNAGLRGLQAEAIAAAVASGRGPTIIAGDTNLPGLSAILRRTLSRFQDGFQKAGWGFGYTYPNDRKPWMRIDRIFATRELRFVSFEVGKSAASDHLAVVADLQFRR